MKGLSIETLIPIFDKIGINKKTKTQLDYYLENNAHPQILKLVKLHNKTFGSLAEKIVIDFVNGEKRTNTTHDFCKLGCKIEVKSARFSIKKDFMWQHIDHILEWDFLIVVAVHFNHIKLFITHNLIIQDLIEKKKIHGQGKNKIAKQGYWFTYNKLKNFNDYFSEIFSEEDLIKYIKNYL